MRPLTTVPDRPRGSAAHWRLACEGKVPAELLPTKDREDLVWSLHSLGWSDVEIAQHTFQTSYTVARIRDRLGLEPNPALREGVA